MKNFYACIALCLFACLAVAQSPTSVFTSSDCNFVRNFNTTDEGFSSPSIYTDDDDVSFFWSATSGLLEETSGLTVREGSLISPVFLNTINGQTVVGFTYTAPSATEYRIRVISGLIGTPLEVLATTATGPVWTPLPSASGTLCLLLVDADLTIAQGLRYEFSFRASQAGDITFDDFAINSVNAPLPVTFLGFVARKNNDGTVKLLWDVGEEINVDRYVVERSVNGIDFTTIGSVPATGKSFYSLEDNELPETELWYYRVKNVDIDGQSKYTPVIKVGGRRAGNDIQLYPMPAKDYLYVQHDKTPSKVNITLYGFDGRLVKQVQAVPNTYQTQVNISGLQPGIYVLKYDDGTGDIQSAKVIKQ